ncbi:hypothetical protein LTR95_002125 [Oleoguttula sp. CCFEE 5521]
MEPARGIQISAIDASGQAIIKVGDTYHQTEHIRTERDTYGNVTNLYRIDNYYYGNYTSTGPGHSFNADSGGTQQGSLAAVVVPRWPDESQDPRSTVNSSTSKLSFTVQPGRPLDTSSLEDALSAQTLGESNLLFEDAELVRGAMREAGMEDDASVAIIDMMLVNDQAVLSLTARGLKDKLSLFDAVLGSQINGSHGPGAARVLKLLRQRSTTYSTPAADVPIGGLQTPHKWARAKDTQSGVPRQSATDLSSSWRGWIEPERPAYRCKTAMSDDSVMGLVTQLIQDGHHVVHRPIDDATSSLELDMEEDLLYLTDRREADPILSQGLLDGGVDPEDARNICDVWEDYGYIRILVPHNAQRRRLARA